MFGLNETGAAFVFGVGLLEQFHQDLTLPQWLAPLGSGGLLTALLRLLPKIQCGSVSAAVLGYVLMALLIFNTIILFTWAQLPNQSAISSSASSLRAGMILLGLFGTGLWVIGQSLIKLMKPLGSALKSAWDWLGSSRSASHRSAAHMQARLLSPSQAIQYEIQHFAISSQQ
jgi:hypothetical protein